VGQRRGSNEEGSESGSYSLQYENLREDWVGKFVAAYYPSRCNFTYSNLRMNSLIWVKSVRSSASRQRFGVQQRPAFRVTR